jgi:DNA-binding CsgD family transcriptional regulator
MEKLPLSKQETKILYSLSGGRLYKEIASDHAISINTVKKHCKNIYRKLEVKNRSQASNMLTSALAGENAGSATVVN